MSKVNILVVYAGAKTLKITDTLEGVIEMILTNQTLSQYQIIKLIFPTGKCMFADLDLFKEFHNGGLHYSELIQKTECDNVYRNWHLVESGNEEIDGGSLWMLNGDILTLVDKDRHITFTLPNEAFEVAV